MDEIKNIRFDDINLEEDEKILWEGTPNRRIIFSKSDIVYLPASILFLLYTSILNLTNILFIILQVYLIFGRFIIKYIKKSRSKYVVTDKRVLKIYKTLSGETEVNSCNIENLQKPVLSINSRKKIGTIYFGAYLYYEYLT